jgi:methionyl-tRNA formyltransferase
MNFLIFTKTFHNKKFLINKYLNKKIKTKLNLATIKKIKPKKIFFIHWSKFIPKHLYENYDCIQFHCSNLPKFRGGSPIQNQILKGIKNTKLSAFKVEKNIDAGAVYLKKKIILSGNLDNILKKIELLSFKMVEEIIRKNLNPIKQKGKHSHFKRRKYKQSIIPNKLDKTRKVYDFIRMLDDDNYPRARLEIKNFIFELSDAKIQNRKLTGKFLLKKKSLKL